MSHPDTPDHRDLGPFVYVALAAGILLTVGFVGGFVAGVVAALLL